MGTDTDPLFSIPEAARFLGDISHYTVQAWLSQGKLQRTKVGSRTMIRKSELERVIVDGGKSAIARSGRAGRSMNTPFTRLVWGLGIVAGEQLGAAALTPCTNDREVLNG